MSSTPFFMIVKKHFDFLFSDYGFVTVDEGYYPELMGNAHIRLESEKCGIQIVLDRNQVLINMGPTSLGEREWFEFSDIVQYFAPEIESVYVFPEEELTYETRIEVQVSRLAEIMHNHCKPVLRGNYAMYAEIKDIEHKRVAEMLAEFNRQSEEFRQQQSK